MCLCEDIYETHIHIYKLFSFIQLHLLLSLLFFFLMKKKEKLIYYETSTVQHHYICLVTTQEFGCFYLNSDKIKSNHCTQSIFLSKIYYSGI